MPKKFGNCLKYAGFNLISLATITRGTLWRRVEDTKSVLNSLNINYAGLDYKPYTIFDLNDSIKIGFCSFAPNYRTPSLLKLKSSRNCPKFIQKCDIIIVSFHGGGEGSKFQM